MTRPLVVDASAPVALLLDSGSDGEWVSAVVQGARLIAPELALFESSNVIRRLGLSGAVSADQAAQAHADLLDLAIEVWPYRLLGPRVWELRANLSSYDASYVALAELTGASLVTLDRRIARAPGVRCEVVVPCSRSHQGTGGADLAVPR